MTLELISQNDTARIAWTSPDRGLWVASEKGDFTGMIERRDGKYIATDALGTPVGSFESLPDAQIALDDDVLQSAVPETSPLVVKAIAVASAIAALCLAGTMFTLGV